MYLFLFFLWKRIYFYILIKKKWNYFYILKYLNKYFVEDLMFLIVHQRENIEKNLEVRPPSDSTKCGQSPRLFLLCTATDSWLLDHLPGIRVAIKTLSSANLCSLRIWPTYDLTRTLTRRQGFYLATKRRWASPCTKNSWWWHADVVLSTLATHKHATSSAM